MDDPFSRFVSAIGRGPGRSRDLSQEEARDAFGMVLRGEADPVQVGAFLMLLRYRGENAGTIAGLVEAARANANLPLAGIGADLDWPSYGAGRTRAAPWFLLAALALAKRGVAICMHGTNEFGGGLSVPEALALLHIPVAASGEDAARHLAERRFAYLPLAAISPRLDDLLGMRRLFGLRSPVNTLVRLLDPAGAAASMDGVFHPPYIETHLGAAELLSRPSLLVIKGGGGEVERSPAKAVTAYRWQTGAGRSEFLFPPLLGRSELETAELAAVWRGDAVAPVAEATVIATIGLAWFALGRAATPEQADSAARDIWAGRHC